MFLTILASLAVGQIVTDYDEALKRGNKFKVPVVCGVGCAAPAGEWITTFADKLPKVPRPSIILVVPYGDKMSWAKTLPSTATQSELLAAVEEARRAAKASPFSSPPELSSSPGSSSSSSPSSSGSDKLLLVGARPDGKLQQRLVSLWPKDLDMPEDLHAYPPTKYTQSLFVLDNVPTRRWVSLTEKLASNDPTPNPNSILPWSVPGGLENSVGWESIRATNVSDKKLQVEEFTGKQLVASSAVPLIDRHKWHFQNGTIFVDLLANKGKAFEVRMLEKINGKWVPKKPHVDKFARPAFFHGAGKACMECHSQAGSSLNYGVTVRGWDGIFSFNPVVDHRFFPFE